MEDGNMANYTTSTSDKSRDKAVKLLLCGGIGLHYFYVGRIRAGLIHCVIGLALYGTIVASILDTELHAAILPGIFMLLAFNAPDLIRLKLGKFRDNVGDYLRQ
jgi:TM2 domain-containing membrane protein YozV